MLDHTATTAIRLSGEGHTAIEVNTATEANLVRLGPGQQSVKMYAKFSKCGGGPAERGSDRAPTDDRVGGVGLGSNETHTFDSGIKITKLLYLVHILSIFFLISKSVSNFTNSVKQIDSLKSTQAPAWKNM